MNSQFSQKSHNHILQTEQPVAFVNLRKTPSTSVQRTGHHNPSGSQMSGLKQEIRQRMQSQEQRNAYINHSIGVESKLCYTEPSPTKNGGSCSHFQQQYLVQQ